MVIGIIAPIMLLFLHINCSRKSREFKKWAEADKNRDLMFKKYLELANDPTMTREKWLEWLPVFRFADEEYAKHNYMGMEVNSLYELASQWADSNMYS